MFADLGLISDDLPVVADKACVEVEDDVDEEEDVYDGVEDKHCDICRIAWCPEQKILHIWEFAWSSASAHLLIARLAGTMMTV